MGVFGDINEVRVMGNITQDLEARRTSNGNSVLNFSLATNRSYRVEDEWKEEVEFHNIVVWGGDAEQLVKRAKKGTRLYVEGRLQTRKWEGNDGKTNYRTEIVAQKVILVDRYEKTPMDGGNTQAGSVSKETASESDESTINPDDLPF